MSELTVASRYAKSLIDLSEEQNSLEVINGDMGFFLKTLKENTQLKAVLSNLIISDANKQQLLAEVKAAVGGEITLVTKVDPSLIGGFVLTIGDRQLDTSVQSS